MTSNQNPPDGSGKQPSFTPYTQGQTPWQPAAPAGPAPYQPPPAGYGYPPGGPGQPRRKRHIVRNVLAATGAIVVVSVAAAAIAGGGSDHKLTTAGSSGPAATTKAKSAPARTTAARIGSTISLAGNTSGEQIGVTVLKVLRHPAGATEFDTPTSAGDRFFAVQFRLADTGTAAYSDAPSNGAEVTDSAGQSYQSTLFSVAGCQSFPGTENIAPGSSGLGCIVFEVPARAAITEVQFTLDSGMGPQTGQWDLASNG